MNESDIEAIREYAEVFAHQIEVQTGVRLSFDLASLARLDVLLTELLDMASVYDVKDASAESLAQPLASYIGEVMVRSLGAEWTEPVFGASSLPILCFSTGQKLNVEESVATVLRGRARPAFHDLAVALERASSSRSDRS